MPSLRFLSFLEMKILFINGQKCPAILILSGLMCLCFYSIFKGRILWQFANNLTRIFEHDFRSAQSRPFTNQYIVCLLWACGQKSFLPIFVHVECQSLFSYTESCDKKLLKKDEGVPGTVQCTYSMFWDNSPDFLPTFHVSFRIWWEKEFSQENEMTLGAYVTCRGVSVIRA